MDLLLFHIGLIEELIDHMVLADPNIVKEEETKDDFVVMDWSKLEKEEEELKWEVVSDSSTMDCRYSRLVASFSSSADAFLSTRVISATSLPIEQAVSSPMLGDPLGDPPLPTLQTLLSPKNEAPKNDAVAHSHANKIPLMNTSPNPMPPSLAVKGLENLEYLVDTLDLGLSLKVQK